eukprot:8687484-Pyramimonas_sp.AAC.1
MGRAAALCAEIADPRFVCIDVRAKRLAATSTKLPHPCLDPLWLQGRATGPQLSSFLSHDLR